MRFLANVGAIARHRCVDDVCCADVVSRHAMVACTTNNGSIRTMHRVIVCRCVRTSGACCANETPKEAMLINGPSLQEVQIDGDTLSLVIRPESETQITRTRTFETKPTIESTDVSTTTFEMTTSEATSTTTITKMSTSTLSTQTETIVESTNTPTTFATSLTLQSTSDTTQSKTQTSSTTQLQTETETDVVSPQTFVQVDDTFSLSTLDATTSTSTLTSTTFFNILSPSQTASSLSFLFWLVPVVCVSLLCCSIAMILFLRHRNKQQ